MGTSALAPYNVPSFNPGDLTTKKGLRKGLGQQYGVNQGLEQQQQNQRGSEFGTLMPQLSGMLDSGYSDSEKSGMQQGTLGAIQGQAGAARDQANRRMARTGNSAGYGSFLNQSARGEGQDLAQQELNNQKTFADEKQKRKLEGLQGIASLYGVDTGFLSALQNNQTATLGIGNSVESRRKGKIGDLQAGVNLVSSII
jgi:hypothetical protein